LWAVDFAAGVFADQFGDVFGGALDFNWRDFNDWCFTASREEIADVELFDFFFGEGSDIRGVSVVRRIGSKFDQL
jgi:hypothetical protein